MDVENEGEIVRAEHVDGKLRLHRGGGQYIGLPEQQIEQWQKNPKKDNRMAWMQEVIHCTHYIHGAGEGGYLDFNDFPDITFVRREEIENQDEASVSFL